jgi:hypothetical protein
VGHSLAPSQLGSGADVQQCQQQQVMLSKIVNGIIQAIANVAVANCCTSISHWQMSFLDCTSMSTMSTRIRWVVQIQQNFLQQNPAEEDTPF